MKVKVSLFLLAFASHSKVEAIRKCCSFDEVINVETNKCQKWTTTLNDSHNVFNLGSQFVTFEKSIFTGRGYFRKP